MKFASKLIHSRYKKFLQSLCKVDTELIPNFVSTLYRLRINFASNLLHSPNKKLYIESASTSHQSWYTVVTKSLYRVDTELIYNFVSISCRLPINFASKLIQSWYRVDTQLCINFLSTPYQSCIRVDTQSIQKVDTTLTQSLYLLFIDFVWTLQRSWYTVDTRSWYKVEEHYGINFISSP
jgi:hypothetical protein